MEITAYVFFAEGFEEIEALTIVDVLRRAEIKTEMISINNQREVVGAHKISVLTDNFIESIDFNNATILILPGGMPGATNLSKNQILQDALIHHNNINKYIGAICAAPFILGDLNILLEKEATCYPGYEKYLKGAIIKNQNVIISKNIITGNGAGSALEFSFAIVGIFKGETFAKDLAKKMMVN